jgi:hypothetical protein
VVMGTIRGCSAPSVGAGRLGERRARATVHVAIGRAIAQGLKREGKTLNELIVRKAEDGRSRAYGYGRRDWRGIAGGALAGLACGPGPLVCVTVGAFVGGAVAALACSCSCKCRRPS